MRMRVTDNLGHWAIRTSCGARSRLDYVISFIHNGIKYHSLICLGCHEFKLVSPSDESRYDISNKAYKIFSKHLKHYRKNRPNTRY